MNPPPVCKAFVICERVLKDATTAQISAVNIVESLRLTSFPGQLPMVHCFLMMTEGIGDYIVDLQVHRVSDGQVVYDEHVGLIVFATRHQFRYLDVVANGLSIERPDRYDFVMLANGQEIQRQTLTIT